MGGLPSREASNSIRTLRYGNHEIGLIPLTRQHFNRDNPELCQQFIRVRNDPNVRYCHMRASGYAMDELPPAEYTQDDLDALVDTIEASLFDTNEDFLNAGAGPVTSFSVAEMHRILQMEGIIDAFDPTLDAPTDEEAEEPEKPAPQQEDQQEQQSMAPPAASSPPTDAASVAAAVPIDGADDAAAAARDAAATTAAPAGRSVEQTFRSLKRELQGHYREAEKDEAEKLKAMPASRPDVFQDAVYRRFKRAVRPLTCAVVFIYVNSREGHDCFVFRGHRINVIGCFGLRTYEEERDDTIPVLQIRKGIVKAAGDRTLERVLALAAKLFVDSFTEVVMRELQRRPATSLLRHVGEEARRLLRQLPPLPVNPALASLNAVEVAKPETLYDPVSVANALFFERMSKYPLLCVGLFNNYPTLKFIFDFSALAISVDEARTACGEHMRLCTYQREKNVRGLAFLFPGRLLAYTWLWSATQTQPPTVRENWVQYTLNEYAQSRERRVQQWLEKSPGAKTMLGNAATTTLFQEHLNNLHSEIVRARTTPTTDQTSWAPAQEYSYDAKLYRIFVSPICGPLLTTVKEHRSDAGKGAATAKKQSARGRSPVKPTPPLPIHHMGSDTGGDSTTAAAAAAAVRGDRDSTSSLTSATPRTGGAETALKAPTPVAAEIPALSPAKPPAAAAPAASAAAASTAAAASSASNAPPHPHPSKPPRGHGGGGASGEKGGAPPPPSYSALARAAFSMAGVSSTTYPSPQVLQQMYMQAIGGIAVPTTPSGAPWVVPQFISPPPPPPPPSPPTAVISPGNSIKHLPPPSQKQQQPQQGPRQPSPPAAAAPASTYLLQIGEDGKQTLMPINLASNPQLGANPAPQPLPSPYQMAGMGAAGMVGPAFLPPGSFPGPQQPLFPLATAGARAGGGVFYAPATSYAPASFIAPLQAPQSAYPAPSSMPTLAMPPSVHYPYYTAAAAPPPPPPPSMMATPTVTVGAAPTAAGRAAAARPPAPPYGAARAAQTQAESTAVQLNQPKTTAPSQQPQTRSSNGPEEMELFANALRLLD